MRGMAEYLLNLNKLQIQKAANAQPLNTCTSAID